VLLAAGLGRMTSEKGPAARQSARPPAPKQLRARGCACPA